MEHRFSTASNPPATARHERAGAFNRCAVMVCGNGWMPTFSDIPYPVWVTITKNNGGSAWESNPPRTVLAPHTGFEVREPHQRAVHFRIQNIGNVQKLWHCVSMSKELWDRDNCMPCLEGLASTFELYQNISYINDC